MSFRLVAKLVTLNDLERRNGRYFFIISANSGSFRGARRKSSRSLSHLLMSSCLKDCISHMHCFIQSLSLYVIRDNISILFLRHTFHSTSALVA